MEISQTSGLICGRRHLFQQLLNKDLSLIPYSPNEYNETKCENAIGFVPIPVGIVGPLIINGVARYIPMATTEVCLVASTNRGCKALTLSGGCSAVVLKDASSLTSCVRMPTAMRAAAIKLFFTNPDNWSEVQRVWHSLISVEACVAGRNVYLRWSYTTDTWSARNACSRVMETLVERFPDLVVVYLGDDVLRDTRPTAINWIIGNGKSVVAEAVIPEAVVRSVLKCSVSDIVHANQQKNHVGSAMAGAMGGFNAHAANIVTAIFLATGQDTAQNTESSHCLTMLEVAPDGNSLLASVTMPCISVSTRSDGAQLPAQAGCLRICTSDSSTSTTEETDRDLATTVACTALAGELSVMAALASNQLVKAHMEHNRKPALVVDAPFALSVGNMGCTDTFSDSCYVT